MPNLLFIKNLEELNYIKRNLSHLINTHKIFTICSLPWLQLHAQGFLAEQVSDYLSVDEFKNVIKEARLLSRKWYKPFEYLLNYKGINLGEILNLKWRDCDFKRNIIYVTETKSGERREIPMDEVLRKTLIAVPKHPESPYIFCNKEGKPYGDIKKSFLTALRKSDIIKFHFHDLRHTFASQMRMVGVGIDRIAEYLSHKSLQMT